MIIMFVLKAFPVAYFHLFDTCLRMEDEELESQNGANLRLIQFKRMLCGRMSSTTHSFLMGSVPQEEQRQM